MIASSTHVRQKEKKKRKKKTNGKQYMGGTMHTRVRCRQIICLGDIISQ
jgi:hypothetical protein